MPFARPVFTSKNKLSMPIKMTTPMSSVVNATREAIKESFNEIIDVLFYVGEEAVNEARLAHTYKDQTGNLTASIGYVVFTDGQPVRVGDFNTVRAPKGDGGQGKETGEGFARSLASEFPTGIALVVVAGMEYASFVADKGYNVIQSAELLSEKLAADMLSKLGIGKGGRK